MAREYAIALMAGNSNERVSVVMLSVDDKAKVNVGHGVALDSGARSRGHGGAGGGSLAFNGEVFCAGDHDFSGDAKLTPKGVLNIDIPPEITGKWSRGQVYFNVADATLSGSEPFSHALDQIAVVKSLDKPISVLIVESDGGADHNMEHMKVVTAFIIVMAELKLAHIVAIRPAAGDSRFNPVERCFAAFNFSLADCSFIRDEMPANLEERLRKLKGGMAGVRHLAEEMGEEVQTAWEQAMEKPRGDLVKCISQVEWTGRMAKEIDRQPRGSAEALYSKYQKVLGLDGVAMGKLTKTEALKSKKFKVSRGYFFWFIPLLSQVV